MRNPFGFVTGFIVCVCLHTVSRADLVIFNGIDPGAGPGAARPNSDAAEISFKTAAAAAVSPYGFVDTATFENVPLSTPGSPVMNEQIIANEMSLTLHGTDLDSGNPSVIFGISNTPSDVNTGYNTTPSGSKYLEVAPTLNIGTATVTFSFAQSINSIGFYLTGYGTSTGDLSVAINDGSSQPIAVTGSTRGGVQYFGLTNVGKTFNIVTLSISNVTGLNRDVFGVDDISFAVVPEPSSYALFVLGLILVTLQTRKAHPRARSMASA